MITDKKLRKAFVDGLITEEVYRHFLDYAPNQRYPIGDDRNIGAIDFAGRAMKERGE